jgi:hypothetical protein
MLRDLTPPQRELAEYMSDLSEEAYCAGWESGLEYALWDAAYGLRGDYGRLRLNEDHRARLRRLSEACHGWIVFDDETEETWIPTAEWQRRLSLRQPSNGVGF